ncbi:EamA-like transporter family protein [Holospora elegans E1]|uniref:EamA-like transporter family protein n=1 Tax=Holospora elegans E1 TaxID=1427503 RepID=A0A023DX83_9PROT|nr:hypothetical protein [Holospora elegans]GAJ45852.1 EamA-like transporter family protein [Holospora elegans E1]
MSWSAIGYKLGACLGFSCLNVAIKSANLSALWIVFVQNLGALFWVWLGFGFSLKFNIFRPLSLLRGGFALSGVLLWTISLKHFSLFQMICLGLFGPCATIFLAVLILQESLTWRRAAAIGVSIFGGLLINYGKSLFDLSWGACFQLKKFPVFPFLAIFCFSASNILAKKMLRRASPEDVGCSVFALTALGAGSYIAAEYIFGPIFKVEVMIGKQTILNVIF